MFKSLHPEIANEKKVALVSFLLEGVGGSEEMNQADRIHPTAEGQVKVAETVWKVLKGELAGTDGGAP